MTENVLKIARWVPSARAAAEQNHEISTEMARKTLENNWYPGIFSAVFGRVVCASRLKNCNKKLVVTISKSHQ